MTAYYPRSRGQKLFEAIAGTQDRPTARRLICRDRYSLTTYGCVVSTVDITGSLEVSIVTDVTRSTAPVGLRLWIDYVSTYSL